MAVQNSTKFHGILRAGSRSEGIQECQAALGTLRNSPGQSLRLFLEVLREEKVPRWCRVWCHPGVASGQGQGLTAQSWAGFGALRTRPGGAGEKNGFGEGAGAAEGEKGGWGETLWL